MELWDLYDNNRTRTGKTARRGDPLPPGFFHLVVNIWIKNSCDEYLIQLRNKPIDNNFHDMWAPTAGSVIAGENSRHAAARESTEELGVMVPEESLVLAYKTKKDDYLEDVWFSVMDIPVNCFRPDPKEVKQVKWSSCDEIMKMKRAGLFIDYGDEYFLAVFAWREKRKTG